MVAARRAVLSACLSLGLASGAAGDVVVPCGDTVGLNAVAEPWEDATRTYANGAIRVIALDSEEPVCCYMQIAVLVPLPEGPGRACFVVTNRALWDGWVRADVASASAEYDPSRGLIVSVPVADYDPETGGVLPGSERNVRFVVNQATGTVTLF